MNSHRLLAGILAVLLPLTASAVPVTYEFSGQVTLGGGTPPPDGEMFVPIIPWFSEFTGSFTYENETPPATQGVGFLAYRGAITGATISFGPGGEHGVFNFSPEPYGPYTTESSYISFINDLEFGGNPPYDQFILQASLGAAPGDPANAYRTLSFSTGDYTAQQIPVGQTLLDPLPVAAFMASFHQLSFGYTLYDEAGLDTFSSYVGSQQITLAQVPTSVPEPGTLPLLGLGLAGIWLATRRRVPVRLCYAGTAASR